MKLRLKLALFGLGAGMITQQLLNCGRFWGDFLGDALWLRGID
jgi:hypothetical protein